MVNGHPLWFHLDSGTGTLVMGASDAQVVGLPVATVPGDSERVPFTIGAMEANAFFYVAPYGFDVDGRHVAGIVGTPFIRSNVITVDYQHERVIVYPPGTFTARGLAGSPLPIVMHGNVPFVHIQLGSQDGLFLIDTGSAVTQVSQSFAQSVHVGAALGHTTLCGFGRVCHPFTTYRVPDLVLGNTRFTDLALPVGVSLPFGHGILGRDLLSHFAVTFDYADSEIFLER